MRALAHACFVVLALTGTARADEVGVVVTGEATIQPQLSAQLEGWLTKHGHQLAPAPLSPDAINTMVDCFVIEDETCARKVVDKRSKSPSLVFARIDVAPGNTALDRDVAVTIYWFEKDRSFVAKRKKCPKCTEPALRATADELIAALAVDAHKVGQLKCTSNLAGADVAVDGRKVGVTPLDHPLAPGKYTIVVGTERRGEETRTVEVKAGEVTTIDVPLHVTDIDNGGGTHRSRILPIAVIGVGAGLAITGGVLLAIHQPPGIDSPLQRHNTAPAGIGFGVAGLAVAAAGTVWFMASGTKSAPVAALSHDGAYLGWVRAF
jgi:PEGA domain-containing protein